MGLTSACGSPAEAPTVAGGTNQPLRGGPAVVAPSLHYFTTSAEGTRSLLWHADLGAPPTEAGTVQRTRIDQVEHARGYAPRGALSPSGRTAWLRLPGDRGHGAPAELWLDGDVVDAEALYLQAPFFVGENLFFLRRTEGPARWGPDGHLLQSLDDFELWIVDAGGHARPLVWDTALWLHLIGPRPADDPGRPDTLLVQRISDTGSEVLEFEATGRLLARWPLGEGLVRDVRLAPDDRDRLVYLHAPQGDPGASIRALSLTDGRRTTLAANVSRSAAPLPLRDGTILRAQDAAHEGFLAIPEWHDDAAGTLWREHRGQQLVWRLDGPSGSLRLVPPEDAAQDVRLLRTSP